ncbi:MAG: hypothetical protein AAF639_32015 [Chloroflexota bacterium]
MNTVPEILVGKWTYRSFKSNPDLDTPFNDLRFGKGYIEIEDGPCEKLTGSIFGKGKSWELDLNGSITYGNPFCVRFQGKGEVGAKKEEWIYDYVGYLIRDWPNGVDQRPAIVGSIVRTIPHSGKPAGVVAQWIAVKQD